jgi:hypothetical protein
MIRNLLLIAHIGAAIISIGALSSAISRFPRIARLDNEEVSNAASAEELFRHINIYAPTTLAVPAIGIVLANYEGVFSEAWVITALATAAAGVLCLFAAVIPTYRRLLRDPTPTTPRSAHLYAGLYNLSWATTLALMVVKPW